MNSRLEELRGGIDLGDSSPPHDHRHAEPHHHQQLQHDNDYDDHDAVQAGRIVAENNNNNNNNDPETDRLMDAFHRETAAIQNVLTWASTNITQLQQQISFPLPHTTATSTSTPAPSSLHHSFGQRLDAIEQKLAAVRTRLRRMATENKQFKQEHANRRPALVHTRIVQYQQVGKRFIDVTKDLETLRREHRDALALSLNQDVKRAANNTAVSDAQVDAALASGDRGLDTLLSPSDGTAADTQLMRHQVADIKSRNAEIQKLTQGLAELQAMFTEMSILVQDQQDLINQTELNLEETKSKTKDVVGELETARKYQKKRNKKKVMICIVLFLILLVIAAIIVVSVGSATHWFRSTKK